MEGKWKKVQLQDIVSILGDGLHGTPEYDTKGDYFFINGNNLKNGRIVFNEKTKRINYDQYIKYKKELNDRTILVSINGTIGNVAYFNNEKVILGKSACYFNLIDNVDKRFIRYVLSGYHFLSYLEYYATGTTIKNVSLKSMREFSFKLPGLEKQKAIAHILGSLDDKIELNRQMNATLEGMAQALFKSWFVDFDPVIDNALAAGNPIPEAFAARAETRRKAFADGTANREVAKQFPAAFQFTDEMGWIPEGWEAGNIGDIANVMGGFAFKSQAFQEKGFPVIKIKNIVGDGTISTEGAQCIGTEDANKAQKFSLNDGDLLMAMTGATVGKIGIVVNGNKGAFLNQRVAKLIGKDIQHFSPFLFCFFKNQANFDQIVGIAGGSAQPNISSSEIESVPCVRPENDVLIQFVKIVNPIFEKWISNYKISKNLSNLRDTLLPKLISGEIRISEAEKLTEEALT